MIQEILSHGGDVLKFSGDAFLVMFKVTPSASLQDAINEAIDTAIIVQKNYGEYKTDVGVTLRGLFIYSETVGRAITLVSSPDL